MNRFPKGSGMMGALLLALLAAYALCAWAAVLPAAGTDVRSIEPDGAALAVIRLSSETATDASGMMNGRTDGNVAPQDGPHSGNTAPPPSHHSRDLTENGSTSEANAAEEQASFGILPWIIAFIVVLSIVLVVLALLPKKNRSR